MIHAHAVRDALMLSAPLLRAARSFVELRNGKINLETGIANLQVGGMSGNLEDFAPNKPQFSRKTARSHQYVMIRGAGDLPSVELVDIEGRLRGRFDLVKTGSGPARLTGAQ